MPIIASRASAAYGAGFGAVTTVPSTLVGSFDALATITVPSGGASTISFIGIPQTYQHLELRFVGRTVASDTAENAWIQFNGDTSANYSWGYLEGDGSGGTATGRGADATRLLAGRLAAANSGSNVFAATIVEILDYASTTKKTTVRTLGGIDRNGSGNLRQDSGLYFDYSNPAVTSIQITNGNAQNYAEYSTFALYGVK
jgi:hypothetical protein